MGVRYTQYLSNPSCVCRSVDDVFPDDDDDDDDDGKAVIGVPISPLVGGNNRHTGLVHKAEIGAQEDGNEAWGNQQWGGGGQDDTFKRA